MFPSKNVTSSYFFFYYHIIQELNHSYMFYFITITHISMFSLESVEEIIYLPAQKLSCLKSQFFIPIRHEMGRFLYAQIQVEMTCSQFQQYTEIGTVRSKYTPVVLQVLLQQPFSILYSLPQSKCTKENGILYFLLFSSDRSLALNSLSNHLKFTFSTNSLLICLLYFLHTCAIIECISSFSKQRFAKVLSIIIIIFFSIRIFFHEHSIFTRQQGKGQGISLTPLYHFHSLHRN